jgi:hypothetical protein
MNDSTQDNQAADVSRETASDVNQRALGLLFEIAAVGDLLSLAAGTEKGDVEIPSGTLLEAGSMIQEKAQQVVELVEELTPARSWRPVIEPAKTAHDRDVSRETPSAQSPDPAASADVSTKEEAQRIHDELETVMQSLWQIDSMLKVLHRSNTELLYETDVETFAEVMIEKIECVHQPIREAAELLADSAKGGAA